jgi:trehalose 6-phosphate synthase/phosphatase
VLPWRVELLRGLLGADLVGFQTASHAEAFLATTRASLGVADRVDAVEFRGRTTRVGDFPISIDAQAWTALAEGLPARTELARYRDGLGQARLIVGVDRLDYTKGILRRLLAFERVLEHAPELRDQLRLVQVTVPSRENVDAYVSMKQRVDELVGRINGRFGTPHHMPVHRVHGQLSTHELAGLYRAADVMMVTPLRDGMNLVAKEFVAARSDGRGVLILSEFAGAAAELSGALLVNPYDVESMALAIRRALSMPGGEQEMRMLAMRSRVDQFGVTRWSNDFMDALKACDAPKLKGATYTFDYVGVTDTEVDAVPI